MTPKPPGVIREVASALGGVACGVLLAAQAVVIFGALIGNMWEGGLTWLCREAIELARIGAGAALFFGFVVGFACALHGAATTADRISERSAARSSSEIDGGSSGRAPRVLIQTWKRGSPGSREV